MICRGLGCLARALRLIVPGIFVGRFGAMAHCHQRNARRDHRVGCAQVLDSKITRHEQHKAATRITEAAYFVREYFYAGQDHHGWMLLVGGLHRRARSAPSYIEGSGCSGSGSG